jgi:hypothetical protein
LAGDGQQHSVGTSVSPTSETVKAGSSPRPRSRFQRRITVPGEATSNRFGRTARCRDEKRVILADTEWQLVQDEGHQNEQLISLFEQILQLTRDIHELTVAHSRLGRHMRP